MENGCSEVFKIIVPHAVKLKASDTTDKQKLIGLSKISRYIGLDTWVVLSDQMPLYSS